MSGNKAVLIPYIATGDYLKMFDGFKKSLDLFCPGMDKIIVYIGDDSNVIYLLDDRELFIHVPHMPWPIIALMKFDLIIQAIKLAEKNGYYPDYAVYFNSNVKFIKEVTEDEFFNQTKLTLVEHCTWNVNKPYASNLLFGGRVTPKESVAYIDCDEYPYIQTSVFGGDITMMESFCNDNKAKTELDLANNIIPTWHDESYANKWAYTYPQYVQILPNIYNASEADLDQWGPKDPKIVLRDSRSTQWKYKAKFNPKLSV